jgi:hypothetical protein
MLRNISIGRIPVAAARLFAIVGLPAYIGVRDSSIWQFLIYAVIAGLALAIAERLTVTHFRDESLDVLAQQSILQSFIVIAFGLPIYLIAVFAT